MRIRPDEDEKEQAKKWNLFHSSGQKMPPIEKHSVLESPEMPGITIYVLQTLISIFKSTEYRTSYISEVIL